MRSDPLLLAEANVPRYTSYPTAPHFHAGIDGRRYATWLSELPAEETLSVYIHVPFCAALCLYCGCNTKAVRRRAPIETYARALIRDIALVGAAAGRRKVSHLHWGGGTPSILGDTLLRDVAAQLDRSLDLSGLAENAIELDPRSVDKQLAQSLRAIGVTRVSLGVQDFAAEVQEAIGRVQSYETIARAVYTLRTAGLTAINFDLMYGLPRQSIDSVRQSATIAASFHPSRVALFGYAHVPWFKPHQRLIDQSSLPGAGERLAQMQAAHSIFLAHDYEPIGFDHFARSDDPLAVAARSGRLRRNFQGYTDDRATTLLGLGASAIGRLPQGFVQNAPDTAGYFRAIDAGEFATRKGIAFAPDDLLRADVIERLMCDFTVDLRIQALRHGSEDQFAAEIDALQPLVRQGLAEIDGRRVVVTDKGRPYVRLIAATFDSYLQASRQRHSVAV
jgi:oxygen-independent coproporphyrinogen-3 oxidase